MRNEELVEVVIAPNQTVATMWAEMLAHQGIPATVRCRDALSVTASIPSLLPCGVVVHRRDIQRALSLIEQLLGGEDQNDRPEE